MLNKKYFQTYLKRKTTKTFCNVLVLFYKGIAITELYIDDIDENIINMSPQSRKKWAWNTYNFLIEEMRSDLI